MRPSVPLVLPRRRDGWRQLRRAAVETIRMWLARKLITLATWVLPRRP